MSEQEKPLWLNRSLRTAALLGSVLFTFALFLQTPFIHTRSANELCRKDIQCWGEKGFGLAEKFCQPSINRLAHAGVHWTDGVLEPKFSQLHWLDPGKGTIAYIGDKVEFEVEPGKFERQIYECDLDPATGTIFSVHTQTGVLPG